MVKFKWNPSGSGSSVRYGYINPDKNSTGKYTGGESGNSVLRGQVGKYGHLFPTNKIDPSKWKKQKYPVDKYANKDQSKEIISKKPKKPFLLEEYLAELDYYSENLNNKGLILLIPLPADSMKSIATVLSRNNKQLIKIDIAKSNIKDTLKSFLKNNPIQHVIIQYDKVRYYCELDASVKQEQSNKHIYYTFRIKGLKKVLYEIRTHATKCEADPYGIIVIYKNA